MGVLIKNKSRDLLTGSEFWNNPITASSNFSGFFETVILICFE